MCKLAGKLYLCCTASCLPHFRQLNRDPCEFCGPFATNPKTDNRTHVIADPEQSHITKVSKALPTLHTYLSIRHVSVSFATSLQTQTQCKGSRHQILIVRDDGLLVIMKILSCIILPSSADCFKYMCIVLCAEPSKYDLLEFKRNRRRSVCI